MRDAVWAFGKSLTLQLFEGGTLVCEMKSGRIHWFTNAPKTPPARQAPLSQFRSIYALKQHAAAVVACVFSPDGERAVTIGADSFLCEWNIKEGKLTRKIRNSRLFGRGLSGRRQIGAAGHQQ